ncbi:MAG: MlaD family protein [Myxococcota bacterium]
MSRGSTRQAAVLGIVTAGALIVFVLGLFAVTNLRSGFSQKITVGTTFNDANGLTRGAAVWFSGVPVGTVRTLELKGQADVRVSMNIDPNYAGVIPADASAYISTDGFVGNTIVVLKGGSADKAGLVDGSTIDADETLTAEQLIAEVRTTNEQIQQIATDLKVVSGRLSAGEGTIGKLLAEDTLYQRLNDTTASLQRSAVDAEVAVREIATVSRSLNKDGSLIDQIANDQTTWPALTASVDSIQQTAASLQAATDDTNTPLGVLMHSQSGAEDLEQTLSNLEQTTQSLETSLEALEESWIIKRNQRKRERRESD